MLTMTPLARPLLLALALACALGAAARADAPDPRALVQAVKDQRRAAEEMELEITVTPARGRELQRRLVMRTWVGADEERTLLRFVRPRDVRGLGLLTVQRPGEPDEQHLYRPSRRRTVALAAADRAGLFAGTDFAYEDLRFEDLERHTYRLLGEAEVDGEACYRIEALPDADERELSGYKRRELLISQSRPIVLEARLFDRQRGELTKVIRRSDIRPVGGLPRAHRIEIDHVSRRSRTVAAFTSWEVREDLDRDDLTVFALERGR